MTNTHPLLEQCTTAKVADLMNELERSGKFFTVDFWKKTDNTFRTMNARFLPGHTRARYIGTGTHHNCLTVWDNTKKDFRQIPLDRVIRVRANGKVYHVVG